MSVQMRKKEIFVDYFQSVEERKKEGEWCFNVYLAIGRVYILGHLRFKLFIILVMYFLEYSPRTFSPFP